MISVPMIAIIDLYLFFIVSLWCILFGNIAFSVIFRLSVAFIRTRWSVGRIPVVSAVSVLVSVVALASLFLLPVLIVVRSLLAVVGFVFFGILLLAVAIVLFRHLLFFWYLAVWSTVLNVHFLLGIVLLVLLASVLILLLFTCWRN